MPKKRRSLQSIFVPSFLHPSLDLMSTSTTSTKRSLSRMRSHSFASQSLHYYSSSFSSRPEALSPPLSPPISPPPQFLLDEDPFANLIPAPSSNSRRSPPSRLSSPGLNRSPESSTPTPRSPLSPTRPESSTQAASSVVSVPHPPALSRTTSETIRALPPGLGHAQPAHKKPAFAPRPSLPSLHTLAKMNVVIPKKVRVNSRLRRIYQQHYQLIESDTGSQRKSWSASSL